MPKEWDGIISKKINRKFSRPLARFLTKYPKITPNQISVVSFAVGGLSGISFFFYQPILGGILAQLSSIFDGVDGDLAILTDKTSSFGGFLDSVLDRYADFIILFGISCSILIPFPSWEVLLIVFAASFGSLMVSYSRALIESNLKIVFRSGFSGYAANRDVRLFIIMICGILNQIFVALLILAIITNLVIIKRIYDSKRLEV
ncbi:MAG: CDP-alcohol phosphatidyltransferase family protein [Promethearchaeota archaeon]